MQSLMTMKSLSTRGLLIGGILSLLGAGACTNNKPGASPAPETAGAPLKVTQQFKIGGAGRWDYVLVDSRTQRLFVPRSDRVTVLDTRDGKTLGEISGTPGVHGVALAPDAGRGFTSNGTDASVTVFDLKTLAILGKVKTGEKPDCIIYDPSSKKVFAFDGRSDDATVFDAGVDLSKEPSTKHIALGGGPEYAVSDGAGHVYVNLEDKSEILQIDTHTLTASARWPLAPGESPSGLAIDAAHHRLFSGCHNKLMVVLDSTNGKVIASLPIGQGVDAVAFDAKKHLAFASCGDGTLSVVKEESPDRFSVVQTLTTQQGARTMALDASTHKIYLPTADFAPAQNKARPGVVPDTFRILVVDR